MGDIKLFRFDGGTGDIGLTIRTLATLNAPNPSSNEATT
jgi:hypothetical protein